MYSNFTPSHRGGSGSPLVCLHGFLDTWRTWELVLPALERRHEVLAPTLPGHAGGPPLPDEVTGAAIVDAVEQAMDKTGFELAHIVGNSLGGYIALQLAARGRAKSVVALAPAGGWAKDSFLERSTPPPDRARRRATSSSTSPVASATNEALRPRIASTDRTQSAGLHSEMSPDNSYEETLAYQKSLQRLSKAAAPFADAIVATKKGRRSATEMITSNYEHIPAELIAHLMSGVAACKGAGPLIENALREDWALDAVKITCPVRIVWGTDDKLLPWPAAAARFRNDWLPQADWVVLDGVGHCPQLDVPLETAELIVGVTTR